MNKITISVSEYNEVNPKELVKLFEAGAKIIKGKYQNGVTLGKYKTENGIITVFSDDSIMINNVILPLSQGTEDYYTRTIEL